MVEEKLLTDQQAQVYLAKYKDELAEADLKENDSSSDEDMIDNELESLKLEKTFSRA